jgi:predicted RNase H-like nuclease (RuvC/YqgF family)
MTEGGDTFNPYLYSGWPQKLRDMARGIEKKLMPTQGNAQELRSASEILHDALLTVIELQRALTPLPTPEPTPAQKTKKQKVRNAMWELWEDRVNELRGKNKALETHNNRLIKSNNEYVDKIRTAKREAREATALAQSLERVIVGLKTHEREEADDE